MVTYRNFGIYFRMADALGSKENAENERLVTREVNNKQLMTGPEGNSEFCFPRISMFPESKSRETLRFEGNKIHCSPKGPVIK